MSKADLDEIIRLTYADPFFKLDLVFALEQIRRIAERNK